MQTQVLILSADAVFARMLELELGQRQITACCMADASQAIPAEVVLLDLDTAMPPESVSYRHMIGFTRNSATAGEEARRRCSLVLRRPFEMRLLCHEVCDLLEGGTPVKQTDGARNGELTSDGSRVRLPDGREILLSPNEAAVLSLLLEKRGEAVTREEIAARIGASAANKADVYVCYLRRKLETAEHRVIQTVRGKGYRLILHYQKGAEHD